MDVNYTYCSNHLKYIKYQIIMLYTVLYVNYVSILKTT